MHASLGRRLSMVAVLVAGLAGCGGPAGPRLPSLSVRCDPTVLTIDTMSASSVCLATSKEPIAGPVLLSCSWPDAPLTCRFDPPSVDLTNGGTSRSTMTLDVPLLARAGSSVLQVSATGGGSTGVFDVGIMLTERCTGFVDQASYSGDCRNRSPATICWGFEDGYVWLVADGFGSAGYTYTCGGRTVSVVRGGRADYHHVLGTRYIKTSPPTR